MKEPSPAYVEFVRAIENEINDKGEVVCVQRFVKKKCTISENYAYYLLEIIAPVWGYHVERIPCKSGGFVLRITRL